MQRNTDEQNPTTVRLTEKAQKIKDDLAPIYGLKNMLSAGLILFGRLPADKQKEIILEALAEDIVSAAGADAAKQKKKMGRKGAKTG